MKYLMWDIDGTLLLSGGAGKAAMIKVIKDYYFLDAFDFTHSLAGRTDSDIIKSVVTRLRGRCNAAETAGLLIRYHMELPHQLELHKGRILKNVEKTLAYFAQADSKYLNCLLTGNTHSSSWSIMTSKNISASTTAFLVKSAKTGRCWRRSPVIDCICRTKTLRQKTSSSSVTRPTTLNAPTPSVLPVSSCWRAPAISARTSTR